MSAHTDSHTNRKTTKTSLDYMAEGYWQDFLAAQPIAGGIAYEAQLHECQLDETLESLQRVDTLISQIRRDHTKSNTLDEAKLLADDRYRHLLWFLAFYAGRVLARQWQSLPHWYGQFELKKHYPKLVLTTETTDDFYQQMAVVYRDSGLADTLSDVLDDALGSASVFFALEPIGQRLFGHIDRKFQAVQGGGQVASGLYQAVSSRLPPNDIGAIASKAPSKHAELRPTLNTNQSSVEARASVQKHSTTRAALQKAPAEEVVKKDVFPKITVKDSRTQQQVVQKQTDTNAAAITSAVNNDTVDTSLPLPSQQTVESSATPTSTSTTKGAEPTAEIFTQLLAELDNIDVSQNAGNDEYQQARKTLDQFERHIARQSKPRHDVKFSEQHQTSRQQALLLLESSAKLGNTAAMLRLAMYELLNEGLVTGIAAGKEAGAALVKQAADKQDIRAQRLLSKMYYQGIGVPQDINNGQHWLEQAAKNGHEEAAELVAQWQKAQALITTQQQEQHSIKRYQLLIGAIVVFALLLVVFV